MSDKELISTLTWALRRALDFLEKLPDQTGETEVTKILHASGLKYDRDGHLTEETKE